MVNKQNKGQLEKANKELSLAIKQLNSGRYKESETILDKLNIQFPNSLSILNILGGVYMNTKRTKLAYDTFLKAYKINDRDVTIIRNLVSVTKTLRLLEETHEYLSMLSSIEKDNLLVKLEIVDNLINTRKSEDALQLLNKIEKTVKDNELVLSTKANCLFHLERFKESKKIYEKVYSLYPKNFQALFRLGYYLIEEKEYTKALDFFSRVMAIKETIKNPEDLGKTYYNIGFIYDNLNDLKEAEENYLISLKYDSGNIDTYTNLSGIFLKKNLFKESLNYIDKAMSIDPKNIMLYENKAVIYDKMMDPIKATHLRRISAGVLVFKPKRNYGGFEILIDELK